MVVDLPYQITIVVVIRLLFLFKLYKRFCLKLSSFFQFFHFLSSCSFRISHLASYEIIQRLFPHQIRSVARRCRATGGRFGVEIRCRVQEQVREVASWEDALETDCRIQCR